MQIRSAAGPQAGALKYDVLTALLTLAAQGSPVQGRLALRLSLLITARFNWRMGQFCVGQREIARMWGVTERTAKRDLAQMRNLGWISVTIPAARGRVATHAIHFDAVLPDTMPYWTAVGPDFTARMTGAAAMPEAAVSNVVPLRPAPVVTGDDGIWAAAIQRLQQDAPALFQAWFSGLRMRTCDGGVLRLVAPTRFIADYVRSHYTGHLMAALLACDPTIKRVEIEA
ncbi:DnaA N-terminal domain-containing protein [Loktanella atrilutea]|uniref:DnaA N-terminal domain-containing protein n=1 Tax=Loktanella atrilutea TaxID=366533 RepID=A0A1M5DAJ5_LOKAT|nr:DnaA N-terminal domain-containing protein [Loktanella atrilutea]SHF64016.1 DnaA N-terminal domain-containing protein [Loktanella atrilutea]